MKKIDMRLRPPYGHIRGLWYYGSRMGEFAKKFGGGYLDQSAKEKSMELLLKDMETLDMQGFVCLRKSGIETVNESGAELLNKYGDKFYGAMGIDLFDVEATKKEIDKYVLNGPFTAVNIEPDCPPAGHEDSYMYYDDERIFPIYEMCEKNDIPITFTYGSPCFGDVEARNPKSLAKILTTFPKIKIALTHGGWPYFNNTLMALAAGFPNLFIVADHYMCGLPGWRDYVDAANTICPDQICFGSSYPLNSLFHCVDFYEKAGFRPDVMEKVYYDNAARFLGLKDVNDREPSEMELIVSGMMGE